MRGLESAGEEAEEEEEEEEENEEEGGGEQQEEEEVELGAQGSDVFSAVSSVLSASESSPGSGDDENTDNRNGGGKDGAASLLEQTWTQRLWGKTSIDEHEQRVGDAPSEGAAAMDRSRRGRRHRQKSRDESERQRPRQRPGETGHVDMDRDSRAAAPGTTAGGGTKVTRVGERRQDGGGAAIGSAGCWWERLSQPRGQAMPASRGQRNEVAQGRDKAQNRRIIRDSDARGRGTDRGGDRGRDRDRGAGRGNGRG